MKKILATFGFYFTRFCYMHKRKIKRLEKIANSITADDLKKHLYIVASAEYGRKRYSFTGPGKSR